MSDLILHHYALSPFSEKVRAMLGYAGLDWQSVTVREMPPRPMLAPGRWLPENSGGTKWRRCIL